MEPLAPCQELSECQVHRMTPDETRSFLLEGTGTAALAMVRADGWPHVAPVWFTLDGNDLLFNMGDNLVKDSNLQRDGRVWC